MHIRACGRGFLFSLCLLLLGASAAWADPSKYPEFAALAPSHNVEYIHLDQLVDIVLARSTVMIVDVRSPQEYAALHITGAVSIPLRDLAGNLDLIPREGLVALY